MSQKKQAQRSLQLDIVTPDGLFFSEPVVVVDLPGADGPFQVLFNHAPLLARLQPGRLRYCSTLDEEKQSVWLGPGFAEIAANKVSVFVRTAKKTEA